MSYDGPGRYRHYKGGEYDVLGLSVAERLTETPLDLSERRHHEVVYRPVKGRVAPDRGTPETVTMWTRPLLDFDADVVVGGRKVPRFARMSDA